MAKWDFKIVGASFVKELVPVDGDVNPRSQSFMQPSFDLEGDKIVMKESGQYKTAISFTQIGEIDGVAPTDLEDAYDKLLVLVENFNGGGGAPGTTPNLTQVITEGDVGSYLETIPNDTFLTLGLGRELTPNYYDTSNVGTGGLFLDKDVIFPENATISFQAGYAIDDPAPSPVTLLPYKFTTDTFVFYQGALVTDITIQPTDLCVLKYAGVEGTDSIQIWLLTVVSKSSGGSGTVTSVMGDLVDNTDPSNPIVNTPSLDDCAVASGNQMTESVTISAGTDAVGLFPTGLNVSDIATGEGIDITKNGILVQTAGSAGGNASIKSDNITAGNTYSAQLPNKAGGSDEIIAMQSDLDFTRRLITKGTGSVTGTVSETILTTLTIPANTLDSSCFIWTTMDFFKTNAGAVTTRLYINNANTLTGATLLGYSTLGSNRNVSFNRKFLVTGTSLDLLTANTAAIQVTNEFIDALFGASTVLTINPSADIFLIYTTQNDATGTVATNKMATVQKMKL